MSQLKNNIYLFEAFVVVIGSLFISLQNTYEIYNTVYVIVITALVFCIIFLFALFYKSYSFEEQNFKSEMEMYFGTDNNGERPEAIVEFEKVRVKI